MGLKQRVGTIEQARAGRLGLLVMTYQHEGDQAALDAFDAEVLAREREGFKVFAIMRGEVPHQQGDIVIHRSYGVQATP